MSRSVLTVISLGKQYPGIFLAAHSNLFFHYRFVLQVRKWRPQRLDEWPETHSCLPVKAGEMCTWLLPALCSHHMLSLCQVWKRVSGSWVFYPEKAAVVSPRVFWQFPVLSSQFLKKVVGSELSWKPLMISGQLGIQLLSEPDLFHGTVNKQTATKAVLISLTWGSICLLESTEFFPALFKVPNKEKER